MEHKIKFYPVGNADCTLIKLANNKTIIVDCQIPSNLNDEKGRQVSFDVKSDLLNELEKDADGHPFVDLFINTHPHDDHCIGFKEFFYQGDPKNYDCKSDKDKVIIGELWITPCGLSKNLCDAAENIRREAKRRRKIYDDNNNYRGNIGNFLRIVGYDEDREFDKRYGYVAGQIVKIVNNQSLSCLQIFIHAPFKDNIKFSKEKNDKNASSIVVHFAFYIDGIKAPVSRLLIGGDAEHDVWQHLLDNNQDNEHLEWNIFLAPHHCSWTFFNESSNKDEVLPSADGILSKQIGDRAFVIASSKEIINNDDNPPCYQARTKYKDRLKNRDNFRNTAIDYVEKGIPQPIVFFIDKNGKRKKEYEHSLGESTPAYTRPAPRAGKE